MLHPCCHCLKPQADIIIDESYAENPTVYDPAALLKTWAVTEAEAATLPAWTNKKVGAACRITHQGGV